MKEPQSWIELPLSDESEWVAARYDSGAMPPGVASSVLKLAPASQEAGFDAIQNCGFGRRGVPL